MAVYEERKCPKCNKIVRMQRCEVCKGTGGGSWSQCKNGCNQHGWLCPKHGKDY